MVLASDAGVVGTGDREAAPEVLIQFLELGGLKSEELHRAHVGDARLPAFIDKRTNHVAAVIVW